MVQFNTRANEILLKLVYYGPGLSGKTTNLRQLHALCEEGQRGEMFSVNTQEDRTLFFDLLPINLGYIYGNAIHLQVYTVPGQIQYDASRRVVLGGADGVVFVADSAEEKMQDNVDSLSNLYHNLNANRLNIKQIPLVMQFNKRDLPDALAVGVMNRRLNFRNAPFFEAIASQGVGVSETFRAITRETVEYTFKKFNLDKKVKDFEAMLALIDNNLQDALGVGRDAPAPIPEPAAATSVILRHSGVTIDDLHPVEHAESQDLLEDALKSSMETARLYSELRGSKDALEQRNEELSRLYAQMERSQQEAQKTRRYLESMVQHLGDGLISFGADGRVLTWNESASRLFGYGRNEALGQPFSRLLDEAGNAALPGWLGQVAQGEVVRLGSAQALHQNGHGFGAAITLSPIRGAEERVIAVSALIRDLQESPRPRSEPAAAAKNILLVEDEPELLELFSEAIQSMGHAHAGAAEGEEAIRLLKGRPFDLVVSDIRLPGLSGMDLYGWIQSHRPELARKVLFTTGDASDGDTSDFLHRNSLPCLAKPFDLIQFQTRIQEMLAN